MPRTLTDNAREDAVIHLASTAMFKAREHGRRDLSAQGILNEIFNQRTKRQARRLLLEAAMHLYGLDALAERQILGSLSSIDLADAYDHETMAEAWDRIEKAAMEENGDCHERMGDAA